MTDPACTRPGHFRGKAVKDAVCGRGALGEDGEDHAKTQQAKDPAG